MSVDFTSSLKNVQTETLSRKTLVLTFMLILKFSLLNVTFCSEEIFSVVDSQFCGSILQLHSSILSFFVILLSVGSGCQMLESD